MWDTTVLSPTDSNLDDTCLKNFENLLDLLAIQQADEEFNK